MLGWATIATAAVPPAEFAMLYPQCSGVVFFQGGPVKVVFVVSGCGHNEKPVRKAGVVGEVGEH